jgi:hypothetical protein
MASQQLIEQILAEGGAGVTELAKAIGKFRSGRPTSPATIVRWITAGIQLPDRRTVRLEAVRLGGRWLSSRQRLIEFLLKQQQGEVVSLKALAAKPVRSPSSRKRAATDAGRQLEAVGA